MHFQLFNIFPLHSNLAGKGTNLKGKFQGIMNANVNVIELETSNAQFILHVKKVSYLVIFYLWWRNYNIL